MTEEARETRWSALRIELQAVVAERDALAAENARLREAISEVLGDWWYYTAKEWVLDRYYPVPAHIVALQDAIYREGGE